MVTAHTLHCLDLALNVLHSLDLALNVLHSLDLALNVLHSLDLIVQYPYAYVYSTAPGRLPSALSLPLFLALGIYH